MKDKKRLLLYRDRVSEIDRDLALVEGRAFRRMDDRSSNRDDRLYTEGQKEIREMKRVEKIRQCEAKS